MDGIARYDCHCAPERIGRLCDPFNESFTCICDDGWKGQNCTEDVDECSDGLTQQCFNKGKCVNLVGSYKCECAFGYTGKMCSSRISYCTDQPCQNGGICYDYFGRYECLCNFGFSGKNCELQIEEDVNNCRLDCQNGATCQNAFSKQCECPSKFSGRLCEIEKPDPCEFHPCNEEQICTPTINYDSFTCQCPPSLAGEHCEHRLAPCEGGNSPCVHGQCLINASLDERQTWHCECQSGWKGPFCNLSAETAQNSFNQSCPLHTNPCQNGGQCVNNVNNVKEHPNGGAIFECICPKGFTGQLCENVPIERHCENGCQKGGKCAKLKDASWGCICLVGFEGAQCEIERNPCSKNPSPCKHKSKCVNLGDDRHRCECAPGWFGVNCEQNRNDCENIVCDNGGKCHDKVNNFWCECSRGFTGRHCETSVPVDKFNRTDLVDKTNCAKVGCEAKYGDHRCDPECNLFACQFDGGDCSTKQAQPFGRCPQASYCAHSFADGKCDDICNNERCLFDGFDCLERPQSKCPWMDECARVYADGHCDEQCNQANCGWDGGDCVHDAHEPDPADDQSKLLLGELFLVIAVHPSTLINEPTLLRQFLVTLSAHLRASLALSIDQYDQKPKLFEWRSDKGIGQRIELPAELNATSLFSVRYEAQSEAETHNNRSKRGAEGEGFVEGIALYLQVDVTMCNMISPSSLAHPNNRMVGVHTLCFSDMENVAAYVGAANAKKSFNDIPATILQSEARKPSTSRLHFWLALLAFAMVAIASAAVGTVFASARIRNRQRRHAKTWKPEIYDSKPTKNGLATMCGGGHHPPLIVSNAHPFNPYAQHNHHNGHQHQQQQLMYNASNGMESCASSTAASAIPLIRHVDSLNSLTSIVHTNNQQQQQQHGQFHQQIHHYAPNHYNNKSLASHNNQQQQQQTMQSNSLHQTTQYCSSSSSSGIGGSSTEHSPIDTHCSMIEDVESRKLLAELRESALFSRYGLLGQEERLEPYLVNAPNERGRILLHLLFENPYFKEDDAEQCLLKNIQLLFTKGAKINALDLNDTSALLLAVRTQNVLAVRKLVTEFEADQRLADVDGCTPLYAACECGHLAMAEFLIGEAAYNSINNSEGEKDALLQVFSALYRRKETPLMRCAIMPGEQWLRIAELLIEAVDSDRRADFVNQTGDAEFLGYSGKTALHWAAECNNRPVIELLVRHGANREATDQKGRTPLFLAVEQGQYQSTETLLRLHADRTKANSSDTKIIPELTERPGFGPIAELFKKYPEQQHHQHIGRPFCTVVHLQQQRPNSGVDGSSSVKIGTKRQRTSGIRRSDGTEDKSDIVHSEVAKKAALSIKSGEQLTPKQQNPPTAGTANVPPPPSGSVIISPPPSQNVLSPPNSEQSVYSTSSPSPNNTSSSSTNCNNAQQVHQHANACGQYLLQQQMLQHHQALLRHSVAFQQQKFLQEHHQHLHGQQPNWIWPNGDMATAIITPKQHQDQQLQMVPPTLAYPSPMVNQPHLMPSFSCGSTTMPSADHLNTTPLSSAVGFNAQQQLQYKQSQREQFTTQDAFNMSSPHFNKCQNDFLQSTENFRPFNTSEFAGLANFACGVDPLSTSLDNLEDLVPDQHLAMEEPSVGCWL
uniref:Notch n=2 Tax=Globodera rostochiensis TaxID=31243 RepID=A0A914I038_GLORO